MDHITSYVVNCASEKKLEQRKGTAMVEIHPPPNLQSHDFGTVCSSSFNNWQGYERMASTILLISPREMTPSRFSSKREQSVSTCADRDITRYSANAMPH